MISSVSVVLSTYGHYDHLEPCLTALDLQTTAPFDILVVDDGGDIEACKAVCERHQNITLVEKPRSVENGVEVNGMAASINIGVDLSHGDLVLIIQRDHVLAADYI